MAQEAQKTTVKPATVPKPGPSPKGILQPAVLGKEPPKAKEDEHPAEKEAKAKEEVNAAEATLQDYSKPEEPPAKAPEPIKKEAAKASSPKPAAKSLTPVATSPVPIADDTNPELRFSKDIEARLTREIEARLRKELEPRIAKEIEIKLLKQFDNQLQRVVNDSVERAIKRHSQPNLQTISREEINAAKEGHAAAVFTQKTPTPMAFKALADPNAVKAAHLLTPGNIAIANHPDQPAMPKVITPADLAIATSTAVPRVATPNSLPTANQEVALPIQSTEPVAGSNTWTQDPSHQKVFQTQQIRTNKVRVSLDDVAPERLIGPSSEDLGKEFLKDAGVSRGGKIAVLMILLLGLVGGSAFGVYYAYGRQVPNPPPRVNVAHATIAGVERGTVRFPEGSPDLAVVFQPPTMLLAQGKGKKPLAVIASKPATPKPATPTPTPVDTPKPKTDAPKLKLIPRENP